ncbi:uncharacterized protein LOC124702975 isoform X4 [Lolium rigidum]|uniref:uncharacterized protein LOC124702975 isoform X4 n=1 Tax=Lolium rigidum TaxID=89674 RepID=UPI001F5C8F71|nr:uncharacterized protein LOC124702975 isoform X4 [Lolium rigidum]XP_047091123.1 uncharacterized protein LOC124702975 isoform X4 [Lolium rigidum]
MPKSKVTTPSDAAKLSSRGPFFQDFGMGCVLLDMSNIKGEGAPRALTAKPCEEPRLDQCWNRVTLLFGTQTDAIFSVASMCYNGFSGATRIFLLHMYSVVFQADQHRHSLRQG